MASIAEMAAYTAAAGACIPLGGLLAKIEHMCLLIPLGPMLSVFGWPFLSTYTYFPGAVLLAAAGGILYLKFQDIAPQSRLRNHWFPPLGAVFGFGASLPGQLLIGGA